MFCSNRREKEKHNFEKHLVLIFKILVFLKFGKELVELQREILKKRKHRSGEGV